MVVRALALCLLSCSVWLVVAASGCTNGTTPDCEAGCGPVLDEDAAEGSTDVASDIADVSTEQ
jgi:hypothetical protein